ncbi:membrane-spanning 4-domains subfamily A member 8-like [Pimephales promelas]|uniref:membrane-spanning 4-domains subfamily A member 8-like n=1 Tax=Pimephales promelas TaxID=90988 RepID=UPI0019555E3E|nr:membrane-spanning 4-domains subfamily A member 8-like [Pimephales promelas]
METSKVISTDKATVVIQVNPQVAQNAVICDDGQQTRVYPNTALTGFSKAQPKALGTVQIVIGVVNFMFGIVRTTFLSKDHPVIIVKSGITYWGSLFYVSGGSLSVAAQNKLHPCVVKASLGMNVINAITAGISIVLMSIEIVFSSLFYENCYYNGYNHGYGRNDGSNYFGKYNFKEICLNLQKYDLGISGILLVFSILQFIISICISGFACKATCKKDSQTTVVNVALNQGY